MIEHLKEVPRNWREKKEVKEVMGLKRVATCNLARDQVRDDNNVL
jgi:hypothetical protein